MITHSASGERQFNDPAWDIESEYPGLESGSFIEDFKSLEAVIGELQAKSIEMSPVLAQALGTDRSTKSSEDSAAKEQDRKVIRELQWASLKRRQAGILYGNLSTYLSCRLSVEAKDSEAKAEASRLEILGTRLEESYKVFHLFQSRCDENLLAEYLDHPDIQCERFQLEQRRRLKDTLLSNAEEILITNLETSGFSAWGKLYSTLSGTMRLQVETPDGMTTMGLSQASSLLFNENEILRRSAWNAIQEAWTNHEEAAASILNSLSGWRIALYKMRAPPEEPMSFLRVPLHNSRIQPQTLEAMLSATREYLPRSQAALKSLAQALGKDRLDPWDLLAPAPSPKTKNKTSNKISDETSNKTSDKVDKTSHLSFQEGMNLVIEAFNQASPDFGAFAVMMRDRRWIETRNLPHKRQGAFCTGFVKSRTPRVFMTYDGSYHNVSTLAHELGHAYHSWIMRDLPLPLVSTPMTLAETASIFAETTLADYLSERAENEEQLFATLWTDISDIASFLVNIPARFEFEKALYNGRSERSFSPDDLCRMTDQAWKNWYGDSISQSDTRYWASKLHFSLSGTSFYNFPYTFGYLFSLGLYARKEEMGREFMPTYVQLLRDTGSMTAEDLINKYLHEDITQPEFWRKSLQVVDRKLQRFEKVLASRTP